MNSRNYLLLTIAIAFSFLSFGQKPAATSSSSVLLKLKKVQANGSVLYIAAHPDDENTRLLSYLANEKLYRTGYLSLTRGDGGQNLIGDEQGIDLGLIRTQELLAARRVDGAEQFFTRAYDFGYSKSPQEALSIWDHEKVLGDVVYVIRKFRPDVIIARFPTTGEGGHGHHTASAILAGEALVAAADPAKYPEHLRSGLSTWQAKRLLWNTFNFGGTNTEREGQFKLEVGAYNPLIGKSYGEMASESRSNHKSQGFGVAAQHGQQFEYFETIVGSKPEKELMDGIQFKTVPLIQNIINDFKVDKPSSTVPALKALYKLLLKSEDHESVYKRSLVLQLIADAGGLFMETIAKNQFNTIGDSAAFNITFNNRTGVDIDKVVVTFLNSSKVFNQPAKNINNIIPVTVAIPKKHSQPYWLREPHSRGLFNFSDINSIGLSENKTSFATYEVWIGDDKFTYDIPVQYKYTDPVKGEIYQPVQFVEPVFITAKPSVAIFNRDDQTKMISYSVTSPRAIQGNIRVKIKHNGNSKIILDSAVNLPANTALHIPVTLYANDFKAGSSTELVAEVTASGLEGVYSGALRRISYDHIPDIVYHYQDIVKVSRTDVKTSGSRAGYIVGAGDKVPEALMQIGYEVEMLSEKDIILSTLSRYDVIVTGIRAYNIHSWLTTNHAVLMKYVEQGGVLLVQYNTNSTVGPLRAAISPYPFSISRKRITDESAEISFVDPAHPVLNYPNKITAKDFEGWVQERSIYHADKFDERYQAILSMKDPGEGNENGSLLVTKYGKGKFIYTGLSLFRQLPAGVSGAYRILANLISK